LLKNLVHKDVNFEAQNALKLTYEEGRRGEERKGAREGSPPIHIPGYATETKTIAHLPYYNRETVETSSC